MRRAARPWLTLLTVIAAIQSSWVAAAAARFVPTDPHFVVANVSQTVPDETLRQLMERWRADPESEAATLALASGYMEHARRVREPRFFGRAEALLAPLAKLPGAGGELRRLYAETLQYRHAFEPAEALLNELLGENPRDADARLRRASLRLTRGDFAGARADCVQLTASHVDFAVSGYACLAEAMAGSGELTRALELLATAAAQNSRLADAPRAYLLATRAELLERSGNPGDAIADYREASRLAPLDDAIRAAWSDSLVLQGDSAAAMLPLQVENPGLALLVRRSALSKGGERVELQRRAREWLALEATRGDAGHHREAALLALASDDPREALAAARRNFTAQRELADVRVLALAIVTAGDAAARTEFENWLRETRYQDTFTRDILARGARG